MIQIDSADRIVIDNVSTGLSLTQRADGTVIYTPESRIGGTVYKEHKMPHDRYSAAHDVPVSGVAGRAQLESDVRALLYALSA